MGNEESNWHQATRLEEDRMAAELICFLHPKFPQVMCERCRMLADIKRRQDENGNVYGGLQSVVDPQEPPVPVD